MPCLHLRPTCPPLAYTQHPMCIQPEEWPRVGLCRTGCSPVLIVSIICNLVKTLKIQDGVQRDVQPAIARMKLAESGLSDPHRWQPRLPERRLISAAAIA